MEVKLVSHVNADGDLLQAWFRYYVRLGISSFHLIVVEFPFRRIPMTIHMLELAGANALYAPLLQRITRDGSLETPDIIDDPFRMFPLCSVDLYQKMGSQGSINKYPLFYCTESTSLSDGGNHNPPQGDRSAVSTLKGVTHHFKFRRAVVERLRRRIHSSHPFRHESIEFQTYLEQHGYRVPTEDSFPYSRRELFRRGLLRRFGWGSVLHRFCQALDGSEKGK
jgi:hypothetical protein